MAPGVGGGATAVNCRSLKELENMDQRMTDQLVSIQQVRENEKPNEPIPQSVGYLLYKQVKLKFCNYHPRGWQLSKPL